MNVMTLTNVAAVLLAVEIAGVFALEIIANRRYRRCRATKTYRPLFVVEDDDGRTRVFERA
jgi:hypothetical protein